MDIYGHVEGDRKTKKNKNLDMNMQRIRRVGDAWESNDVMTLRVLNSKLEQMKKNIMKNVAALGVGAPPPGNKNN